MALVHLLMADDYDKERGRFKSVAFEPHEDGSGISVFERNCALRVSGCECTHGSRFYRPPIEDDATLFYFWIFERADIPYQTTLTAQPSTSGDTCHREICGLTKKNAKSWFKKAPYKNDDGTYQNLYKCDDDARIQVSSLEDL